MAESPEERTSGNDRLVRAWHSQDVGACFRSASLILVSAVLVLPACDDGSMPQEPCPRDEGEIPPEVFESHGETEDPPGCDSWAENLPSAAVIGDNTVRITTVGDPCSEERFIDPDACSYDDYTFVPTLPNFEQGEYFFSEGVATLTMVERWDHEQSASGCDCRLEGTPVTVPITSGRLVISNYAPDENQAGLNFYDLPDEARAVSGGYGFALSCDAG